MSGHSKWSTIKRKKGANDAKRGKIFTRLAREIAIAAREGGSDPESNFSLRLAVDKAKTENMPKENIERAIRRGTGDDKDSGEFEEVIYEGYAPHGIALIIQCLTDNRNRAVSEIRHILNKSGGSLGEGGSVAWQFTRMAYFAIPSDRVDYETIFELAAEAGADDVTDDDDAIEITGEVEAFKQIADKLRLAGIQPEEAGLRMFPNHEITLDPAETIQVMRIIEGLEDLDDVQNIFSNLHISDEALSELELV